jgi:hypothetical protein
MYWAYILKGVGTAVEAGAQIRQGYQAGNVADYNAEIARQNRKYAEQKGAVEQQLQKEDVRRILGRQRVISGASGGGVDTGQSADISLDTLRSANIDAAIMRYDTEVAAKRAEATESFWQEAAGEARTGGWIAGGTTLLNAAVDMGMNMKMGGGGQTTFNPSTARWQPRTSPGWPTTSSFGSGYRWGPRRRSGY